MRDLGIVFDRQLTFKPHISDVIDASTKSLGFLMRLVRRMKSVQTQKVLFLSLVRSKLEYADIIWLPNNLLTYIDAIEKCERRFAKFLVLKSTAQYSPQGIDNTFLYDNFNLDSL